MKKILLSAALIGSVFITKAQTLYYETFSAQPMPYTTGTTANSGGDVPSNMITFNDANTPSSTLWGTAQLGNKAWAVRRYQVGASSFDTIAIATSWFNPAAIANRWMVTPIITGATPATVASWTEVALNASFPDGYEVRIATTNLASPTQADFSTVLTTVSAASGGYFSTKGTSLGSYAGVPFRLAFVNNSNDMDLLGIDDIKVEVLTNAFDAAALGSAVSQTYAAIGTSVDVLAAFKNLGYQNITAITANYSVNNGPTVSQNLTGLNLGYASSNTFTFTQKFTPTTAGLYNIKVWFTLAGDVNTTNDMVAADAQVVVASQTVTRNVLFEEFTSSTCAPCASLNSTLDPALAALNPNVANSKLNAIKYQMDWPSPGTDPSFNPDGDTRRGYYGVSGIPNVYIDGNEVSSSTTAITTEIANRKLVGAFADMTVTFNYNTTTHAAAAVATVKPYFDKPTGFNYALLVAVTEDSYNYQGGTTSQKDYHNIQRKMFPDGNGTDLATLVNGTTQSFSFNYTFPGITNPPAQGSYDLWANNGYYHCEAWLQDVDNGDVLQSVSKENAVGIQNINGTSNTVLVFPTFVNNVVKVDVTFENNNTTAISIVDIAGKEVYNMPTTLVNSGRTRFEIPTTSFNNGLYFVVVTDNAGNKITEKIVVTK